MSPKVKHNTLGTCVYPEDSDFAGAPANLVERRAVLDEVATTTRIADLMRHRKLPASSASTWALRAITPLNMPCDTFKEKDLGVFGRDAYRGFADLVIRASIPGALEPHPGPPFRNLPVRDPLIYPDVAILRRINTELIPDNEFAFIRSGDDDLNDGEDTIHSIPLTEKELAQARELEKEGIISVVTKNEPFENAYGENVSGSFLRYPDGSQVDEFLDTWQQEIRKLESANSEKDYIAGIGRQMRKCITIHPFHNGNGRTCTIWAVYALARRDIPHALLWAGEDVLLSEAEWTKRFSRGVAIHRELLTKLGKEN